MTKTEAIKALRELSEDIRANVRLSLADNLTFRIDAIAAALETEDDHARLIGATKRIER